ncbi:uncharacterized protein CTHT_0066990 [Thermochaetoides thermophila DSM 1495]|uniref:Uncharacterized protein n=1 Tax=Chaetomium thermophilum (strain DSM 1495 / CBS 144.50 / IMI 039719) TaxID=759272 RepID=G0SGN5_CHATD|nr:hypothetical protein CTHT_0066990 [Thermochaetoides thermophila DSM 1495]EGS17374.1 hypothetical protein CTHT_0066990 [Thermochaetoides thermophila DSM 1495]
MPSLFGKSGSTLGRAKSRHKSIRGTISAPIPIPTSPVGGDFPFQNRMSIKTTVTADDDLLTRRPGTGATPPGPVNDGPKPDEPSVQSDLHRSEDLPAPRTRDGSASSGGVSASRSNAPDEKPSTPPQPLGAGEALQRTPSRSPSRKSLQRRTSPARTSPSGVSAPAGRATNPALSSTVRYSVISDTPSKQTTQGTPVRKKSTFRSALEKIFGRGRKKSNEMDPTPPNLTQHAQHAQHRSVSHDLGPEGYKTTDSLQDPSALVRPAAPSPKRSASAPISEYDRPLRSHSIGPEDIMMIESARNSLHADAAGIATAQPAEQTRRRAATTGNPLLFRPHLHNQEWGHGLSPRPASAQGRRSRLGIQTDLEDPSEIGRAITSDSGHGTRRRSRSLSGLQDLASMQSHSRRRSDEIRYWRESYDPGFTSPISSNIQGDIDDTAAGDPSAPVSPTTDRAPRSPPQPPFSFGTVKEEEAAAEDPAPQEEVPIETRVVGLEARTAHLEQLVDKLSRLVPGFDDAAQHHIDLDARSQVSIGEAATNPGSRASPRGGQSPRLPFSPAFNPVVRGASSLPILGGQKHYHSLNRDEVIAELRNELEAERAARQVLEAQVKKLSERVNTLSTTMFAMVRGPSETRLQERLGPPAQAAKVVPISPLPLPRKVTVPRPVRQIPVQQQHQQEEATRSVFESSDEDDETDTEDEGTPNTKRPYTLSLSTTTASRAVARGDGREQETAAAAAAEEEEEEEYQTPKEEARVPRGAFGEVLRDDYDDGDNGEGQKGEGEEKRKKAARTLSLSQLTMRRRGV